MKNNKILKIADDKYHYIRIKYLNWISSMNVEKCLRNKKIKTSKNHIRKSQKIWKLLYKLQTNFTEKEEKLYYIMSKCRISKETQEIRQKRQNRFIKAKTSTITKGKINYITKFLWNSILITNIKKAPKKAKTLKIRIKIAVKSL